MAEHNLMRPRAAAACLRCDFAQVRKGCGRSSGRVPGQLESHSSSLRMTLPDKDSGRRSYTLDPSGDRYYCWLVLMGPPILYNWVILICRFCFPELQQRYLLLWLALDYLCDLLYLMDIVVHFYTGFLEEGFLIQDHSQISRRYRRSSTFLWDLLSVLPTDLLYLHVGLGMPAVRANRLLRSPRMFEAFDRIETRTAHPNSFRISKLMLYVFITIHWNSCIYFALSDLVGFGTDEWVYPNSSLPGFDRLLRQYLYSFYFSTLILTTVGDTPMPQREEEYLFMAIDFLLAVMGFATIMGSMTSVISNMNHADAAFYPNYDLVKGYLHTHRVSQRLQHRVVDWQQHLQMNKKMTNELQILQHLPERLRAEVAVSVHLPTLRKVQIFQNCEQSLLEELVLKLKPQVYSPGEYVCRKGDIGREMYFIREGQLAVVADDGVTQYAVLGEGLYFGEISIISIKGNKSGNRRTANIKSIGYSDLFCLSKEDLKEVLAEFPNAKAMMEAKGREILLKMGKLDINAEAAEIAQQQEEERRTAALEEGLDALQTKLARVLAGLESSAFKMALRLERLEWQLRDWGEGEGRLEGTEEGVEP
ncbi:cyclic nucleotide-gated cation channel alpha-4 [Python bivittatus]|uniref:Cyclic nucleotide-gated cation channel alpha-4 n=1 Tax=Python bivittatus TaxID=176946 RepID=A0A9F2RDZ2_PYTBI|nr:cyclic nucleotide-gated cation channel alpha-4 [Python bivittatus]